MSTYDEYEDTTDLVGALARAIVRPEFDRIMAEREARRRPLTTTDPWPESLPGVPA